MFYVLLFTINCFIKILCLILNLSLAQNALGIIYFIKNDEKHRDGTYCTLPI